MAPQALAERPFALTLAQPVQVRDADAAPVGLALCPTRQVAVVDGTPYIHAPHMGSQYDTTYQTREDSQIWTDSQGTDTD